ncbi:hypothetical protein EYC84_007992 [Monilinia fructicola]|uniref:Enoyl reductase (ER) domain-containing protein n=1 Tax=Monilinia fructicola TaxID=38448 RepID=A0A5M9JIG3_MONFR|nr:hypothetical protein EYC84_007992 [Monilinia fructicola]
MTATQQQSLIVQETGKPVVEVTRPIPTPKEDEVVIKITSAGINPHDENIRDLGLFNQPLPNTLCNDVAGIIIAKGEKVFGVELNDHVFGYAGFEIDAKGSQQYAILQLGCFAEVPSNITDDQAATFPSVVILGGGSSCGKFAVQVAKITRIGKIVVVASSSNTDELKSYGATHVIDRHGTDAEIKARVQDVVGDELSYVYDPINKDHSLAVSLLSEKKRGKVATLLPVKAAPGNFDITQTMGLPHWNKEFSVEFFKLLPGWIKSGELKPLGFKLLEGGLNVDAFNKVLDDHRDGKNPGKWHFHPNDL